MRGTKALAMTAATAGLVGALSSFGVSAGIANPTASIEFGDGWLGGHEMLNLHVTYACDAAAGTRDGVLTVSATQEHSTGTATAYPDSEAVICDGNQRTVTMHMDYATSRLPFSTGTATADASLTLGGQTIHADGTFTIY
jgi:hypothetical protein